MASRRGLEPRITGPKPVVLPITPTRNINHYICLRFRYVVPLLVFNPFVPTLIQHLY